MYFFHRFIVFLLLLHRISSIASKYFFQCFTSFLLPLLHQAIPLTTSWNDESVSDFKTCSFPYQSSAWTWISGVTVFIIPTIVIFVCYSLMVWKMYKENLGVTADRKDTFSLFLLTIVFFLCWWPTCIYLSVK